MSNLSLSGDHMKDVIAKAILDGMTPEDRNQLITGAVKDFISKADNSKYGLKTTPLEDAFSFAVREVARETIKSKIENDSQLRSQITASVATAIERAFTGENEGKMIDAMTDAVSAAFRVQDRY